MEGQKKRGIKIRGELSTSFKKRITTEKGSGERLADESEKQKHEGGRKGERKTWTG